jgi:hypothetical protein
VNVVALFSLNNFEFQGRWKAVCSVGEEKEAGPERKWPNFVRSKFSCLDLLDAPGISTALEVGCHYLLRVLFFLMRFFLRRWPS